MVTIEGIEIPNKLDELTVEQFDKLNNIEASLPSYDSEIKNLQAECYTILEKNMVLEKENTEKMRGLKENTNNGLANLEKINQGIKKYISPKKPHARFLDKKR